MIIGIGTDLTDLERIEASLERFGQRFISRVLTQRERESYGNRKSGKRMTEWMAGRFAAKEAFAKAWGTGIGESCSFQDIEIIPDPAGKPEIVLSEKMNHPFAGRSFRVHLSITHSTTHAMAFVVIESAERGQAG